jgi:hypothetical protein
MKKLIAFLLLAAAGFWAYQNWSLVNEYTREASRRTLRAWAELTGATPASPPAYRTPAQERDIQKLQAQIDGLDKQVSLLRVELKEAEYREAIAKSGGPKSSFYTSALFLRNSIGRKEAEKNALKNIISSFPPAPPEQN